ncbi:MAG: TetR/AcrR family transcriptional regulator [Verrucomicrobiota bacterium]
MARPHKHDRAAVLETATSLFWEWGFQGVSIKDLVEETGMLAGSFYASFGSKEGLFIECIHHYAHLTARHYEAAQRARSPLKQIESLLRNLESDSLAHGDRRACFMINTLLEIAPRHPSISKVLKQYLELSETWIEGRLEAAKEAGELDPKTDSKKLAACIFGVTYAVRVKARAGESVDRLRYYRKTVFGALVDPWRIAAE